MKKFILMTTAIIRPELHSKSIKKFYDEYYLKDKEYVDNNFEIHHIINIDSPVKLKAFSSVEKTIDNFSKIIPSNINKHYICPEISSFASAFKNIMEEIKKLNLLDPNNYYFWFEDDWVLTKNICFFRLCEDLLKFKCCAVTMTSNAQCGSFRGGPIMNGNYFSRYFNLVELGYFKTTKDPESQVRRWIGKYATFGDPTFLKVPDKKIKLLLVSIEGIRKYMDDFGMALYRTRFNKAIGYEKHIVACNNQYINNGDILYLQCSDKTADSMAIRGNYMEKSYYDVVRELDGENPVYIIVKPYNFEDCGREFAKEHQLIKWATSEITYQ